MAEMIAKYIISMLLWLFFGAMFGVLTCAALSGIIKEWMDKRTK